VWSNRIILVRQGEVLFILSAETAAEMNKLAEEFENLGGTVLIKGTNVTINHCKPTFSQYQALAKILTKATQIISLHPWLKAKFRVLVFWIEIISVAAEPC
jgi:4-hydroxyphenylpyruvate dioxygenase-like putative hemolysin